MTKLTGDFKLVMFDMDGTLLNGRSIFVFAEKIGFLEELNIIFKKNIPPYKKSLEIACLLKGVDSNDMLEMVRDIPFNNHVKIVVEELKNKGLKTAIVTDGYQFIADDVKKRLDFDYAFANNLILENGIVIGEVVVNNSDLLEECSEGLIYSISKSNILSNLCKELSITQDNVIAVGDGMVDSCMLKKAGLGFAFNASSKVEEYADICIDDMRVILNHI